MANERVRGLRGGIAPLDHYGFAPRAHARRRIVLTRLFRLGLGKRFPPRLVPMLDEQRRRIRERDPTGWLTWPV